MALKDLKGRIALVAGGSNGIGAATVKALAEMGARVIVGYHSGEDRARTLAGSLPWNMPGETGHGIVRLALEDAAQIRGALADLAKETPRLDILINSAGFTTPVAHADLVKLDDDLYERVLIANARGPYSIIRAALPMLQKSEDAVIVNVSSISAFTGSGSSIAYCAAKAALDTMSVSLARVLGPKIRVVTVSPAAVATDFVAGRGREQLEKIAQATPLKRISEAEDVADAIMASITHLRTMTGARVVVDGGRHL